MVTRDNLTLVKRFYDAISALDPKALLDVLEPDLVAHVSSGLGDYGGTHQGARAMLEKVWVPAHLKFRAMPTPDEFFESPPNRVAAIGFYRGRVEDTGREFEAAFCHVFRCNDERISELRQITDTVRWMEALEPA